MPKNKKMAQKRIRRDDIWCQSPWKVVGGALDCGPGRPCSRLFRIVAEKIPFAAINRIAADLPSTDRKGVYVAHDSMGYARYIGRGNVIGRLKAVQKKNHRELHYFSFYIIDDKRHEREIETLLIRAAGPQLHFNSRKKRMDIEAGNVRDFEGGTRFYERQYLRGRKPAASRRSGADGG